MDSAKLTKIRLLAAKEETTTGDAISLDATDADYNVMNPVLTPEEATNERELQASLGQLARVAGADRATITFSVELSGSGASGAVPPWASTFLPACDMVDAAGTFTFTRGEKSVTIVFYEDGLKKTLAGCRGTFSIVAEDGAPAMVNFEFTGKYTGEADDTILAPTFPTVIPPTVKGTTLSFHSVTPKVSRVQIDTNNEVVLREDITDATGYHAAAIVNRKPSIVLDPEAGTVATKDWVAIRNASTAGSLNFVIGSATNNTVTIAASAVTINRAPSGDRNGILTKAIEGQFNSATPFSIAFS